MAKKPLPGKAQQRPQIRPQVRPQAKAGTASVAGESNEPAGWLTFALVAMAITALCYLPSLSNGLVNWDDDPNITENPNLQRINEDGLAKAVPAIFSIDKGAVIGNYNPLPILTFAIEKSLAGGFGEKHTRLIHIDNLLLHLLTVFFAMKLLARMGIGNWGSFLGGLLFGIHPMRVESVAWATERKDVLFAVFFFAALVYYVKWLKQEEKGESRVGTYMIMLFLATLSCLSKVQAVTLPLSMLVLDYWFRRPLNFKLILEKTPFWALSLAFGLINLYTLRQQGSTDDVTQFNFLQRLCIGSYSFVVYLYKLVFPYPMSPLYPYPKPLPWEVYVAPVFFAAFGFFIWRMWKLGNTTAENNRSTEGRIWVFGALFMFFNVMFLLQVLGAGQGLKADRFTYVPYFGFFAVAAWYYEKYCRQENTKTLAQILAVLFCLASAVWTVKQIGVWKNGETLWTHVIKFEGKSNSLPYWNRGQYFRAQGDFNKAMQDYTQAVTINPENPELYNSRGKTYFDMAMSGKFNAQQRDLVQKAIKDYSDALSKPGIKNKSKAEILINRGAANGFMQNSAQSIQDITEGLKIDPSNENGYFNRSIAYFNMGQIDNALADYNEYLKYNPYNADVLYESGMILRSKGQNPEAIERLTKAIQLKPNLGIAYLERARAYMQSGNKAAAQQDYQRAEQLGVKMGEYDLRLQGQ
ncbi:MAG TPA: tetratricopeptide repeat protein [Saprospiraceae bacterium]|nr:tetratricopeptide repeat protein [Saprospiraceae bacterium]